MRRTRTGSSRRKRRGAALVEGIIVALLLAGLLAAVVFAHRLYSAKLATIITAREQAWAQALPGCEGGLAMGLLNSLGTITQLTDAYADGPVDTPGWLSHGRGVGNSPTQTVQSGPLLGGRTFTLETRTSIACNEFGDDEHGSLLTNLADIVRDLIPGIFDR